MIPQLVLVVLLAVSVLSNEEKCGYAALSKGKPPTSRILNSEEAIRCQWPWMVTVRRTGSREMCSGVLVGKDKVLTTARCTEALKNLGGKVEVVVGEYNIDLEEEKDSLGVPTEVIIAVTSMTTHPDFDGFCLSNDISVVKLERDVEYGECALPACLTSTRTSDGCDDYIEQCVIGGWGKYKAVTAQRSSTLRWAYTQMLGPEVCGAIYRYGDNSTLPDNVFCLDKVNSKQPACLGDEGGMVICNIKGTWTLKGLISLASCDDPMPTLAVDLANARINEFILNN